MSFSLPLEPAEVYGDYPAWRPTDCTCQPRGIVNCFCGREDLKSLPGWPNPCTNGRWCREAGCFELKAPGRQRCLKHDGETWASIVAAASFSMNWLRQFGGVEVIKPGHIAITLRDPADRAQIEAHAPLGIRLTFR